jgi:hypothetical protein
VYDLLWKFYEKSGQFIAAARVLSRLADAHSTAISLPLRIEYLSRAISFLSDDSSQQLTHLAQEQPSRYQATSRSPFGNPAKKTFTAQPHFPRAYRRMIGLPILW